jgi:hypothetical protein
MVLLHFEGGIDEMQACYGPSFGAVSYGTACIGR